MPNGAMRVFRVIYTIIGLETEFGIQRLCESCHSGRKYSKCLYTIQRTWAR
jgi:hypothetical protein